jgi:hypothetical protein
MCKFHEFPSSDSMCKFHAFPPSDSHAIYTYCPHFFIDYDKLCCSNLRINLPNYELRDNRCTRSCSLLKSVNEFVSVLATTVVQCSWDAVRQICTYCCWAFVSCVTNGLGKAELFL